MRCPGGAYVGPSAAHTCTPDAPAGEEQEPAPLAPAAASLAESGAARGRRLPGPTTRCGRRCRCICASSCSPGSCRHSQTQSFRNA
jgi:hypothetical protein